MFARNNFYFSSSILLIIRLFCFEFFFSSTVFSVDFFYNKNGSVAKIINDDQKEIFYYYDKLNMLNEINFDKQNIKFYYDFCGKIKKITDHNGSIEYYYDLKNRLVKSNIYGNNVWISYNFLNQITVLKYPNNYQVNYHYDEDTRLAKILDYNDITIFKYSSDNLLVCQVLPNNITSEFEYYSNRLPKRVIHCNSITKEILAQIEYFYDKNFNCTLKKLQLLNDYIEITYKYDSANRIIEALYSNGFYEKFVYDSIGNRLSKITPTKNIVYQYDKFCRLLSAGDTLYKYNQSGCLIEKISPSQKIAYKFNSLGQLVNYNDGKNNIIYKYDGNGLRISKIINGKHLKYIYNPLNSKELLIESDSNNMVTKQYIYGKKRIKFIENDKSYYILYDGFGNVIAITNESGNCTASFQYDSFGVPQYSPNEENFSFQFSGEYYDKETNLIYLNHRYYDPEIGADLFLRILF